MEENKRPKFKAGDKVYYTPQRKNKGLARPVERAVVIAVLDADFQIRLNAGHLRWVKSESLEHLPPPGVAP